MSSSLSIQAQTYRFSPYPDLWFNDVDGIRLGVRILGEIEGTFKDGPHRLDAGLWVGSKLPENPVSYYISFTEPIAAFSDFGSEGSVQLISSSRTGYALHQLRLNKRWQKGFDELDYFEISVYGSYEKNFELAYRNDPDSWSTLWKSIVGSDLVFSRDFDRFRTETRFDYLQEIDLGFSSILIESINAYSVSETIKIRARTYFQATDEDAHGEYFSYLWSNSQIEWLRNGFKRAQGTIPESSIGNGFIQFSGGPNLRGYTEHQVEDVNNGVFTQYETVYGINIELVLPNPINNQIKKNQILRDLVQFESYVFIDAGGGLNESRYSNTFRVVPNPPIENTGTLYDVGIGFQLSANIPDYLGKDRGIFIRYDIPLWLSSTSNNESNLKYRNVIGIGAIFNF